MEKPLEVPDYIRWLRSEKRINITDQDENYYSLVANAVMKQFKKSEFWVELLSNLIEYDEEYQLKKDGYTLLSPRFDSDLKVTRFDPEVKVKTFNSLLEKSFRKNVLNNDAFPKEPKEGWIIPENWFLRINDIVRTLFVVKYFDGVKYLISKIEELCKKHNLELLVDYEAKEEGYYAAHLYVKQEFEIPKPSWDTKRVFMFVEIQITTQLQEVIRKLLHNYYEKKRMMVRKPIEKWQWDYACDEFYTNYLGHILHYLEGQIMVVRNRQKREII